VWETRVMVQRGVEPISCGSHPPPSNQTAVPRNATRGIRLQRFGRIIRSPLPDSLTLGRRLADPPQASRLKSGPTSRAALLVAPSRSKVTRTEEASNREPDGFRFVGTSSCQIASNLIDFFLIAFSPIFLVLVYGLGLNDVAWRADNRRRGKWSQWIGQVKASGVSNRRNRRDRVRGRGDRQPSTCSDATVRMGD